jgi:hypothetical protein
MPRTGPVGEWKKPNQKQASGLVSHHVCQTRRGFVESSARKRLRVFCAKCQSLRAIAECADIHDERENSSTFDVILSDCGHSRSVTIAVEFTPSQKEKRGISANEIESVDPETLEIRSAMQSDGLL